MDISLDVVYKVFTFAAIVINASLVLLLSRKSERTIPIVSFVLFLMCINTWAVPDLLINTFSLSGDAYVTADKISSLGYIFLPVTFLLFALSFTLQQRIIRQFWFWISLMVPSLLFLFLSWTTNSIHIHDYSQRLILFWGYTAPIGDKFLYFLIWLDSIMALALSLIIHEYRTTADKTRKKQALVILIAVLIPLGFGTISDGIFPLLSIVVFPTAIPLTSLMAIIIVYAIFRYGLFEVTPFGILSSIQEGIITVDSEGGIMEMNNFAEKMLNVRAANVVSKSADDILILKDDAGKKVSITKKILPLLIVKKEKKSYTDTCWIDIGKKERYPFAVAISPLYSGRSILGITIILRNVKKEREREKSKDDFISMISHELKTPITSIKAYNQLLLKIIEKKENASSEKQLVIKMNEQVDRLNKLLANFLEVSRLQSGKLRLEKEFFNCNDVIQSIIDDVAVANKQRTIIFRNKLDTFIYADKRRFEQVITNLINNSLKYSPKNKKVVVSMSTTKQAIIVSIKDYGVGIPAEYRKKIFDQFYQVGNGKMSHSGLGMGLYIAANIVKQHNGKIWVESIPGKGATFSFLMPVR